MPRKVVAMWNEEDAVARAKLLLAFGFYEAYCMVEGRERERRARMDSELAELALALTEPQKEQVVAFLEWYGREHIEAEPEQFYSDRRAAFDNVVRAALGLPSVYAPSEEILQEY